MLGKYIFKLISRKVLPEKIEIRGSRCLNKDRSFACCRECVRICRRQNLTLSEQGIPEKSDRCEGCGLCISICPTAALNFEEMAWNKLNRRLIQASRSREYLQPVCKKLKKASSSQAVVTGCPGSFSAAHLIALPALGTILHLPFAYCREIDCSNVDLVAPRLNSQIELIEHVFINYGEYIHRGRENPELKGVKTSSGDNSQADKSDEKSGQKLKRREIFSSLARKSGDILEDLTEMGKEELRERYPGAGQDDGLTLPRELLQLICRRSASNKTLAINESLVISAIPKFQENDCTYCRRCEKLCPTDALKFEGEDVLYYPGRCTGCQVCVDRCRRKALEFVGGLRYNEFTAGRIDIEHDFRLEKCPDCGALFNSKSGRNTCYFC